MTKEAKIVKTLAMLQREKNYRKQANLMLRYHLSTSDGLKLKLILDHFEIKSTEFQISN